MKELSKNYERNNILLISTENYSPLLNLDINKNPIYHLLSN